MEKTIKGELEIDYSRGVIYFHLDESEIKNFCIPTLLRICSLGKIPEKHGLIDITHMKGISIDKGI